MRFYLAVALLGVASVPAWAAFSPPLPEIGIRLPELVSKSSFVCKGEVTSAPQTKSIDGPLPRKTGIAVFRIDTCFKGELVGDIDILADEYLPAGGWGGGGRLFTPKAGEYLLLFVNRKGDVYDLPDDYRGALPVSRLASAKVVVSAPLDAMEDDFVAGLNDPDPELELKSIFWLGCMGHLQSLAPLHLLLPSADPLQTLYVWEALLKLGDTAVIRDVAQFVDEHQPLSRTLFLPADRIPQMTGRVFLALCGVRNSIAIPYLSHFTESADPHIRVSALMGLRAIGDIRSASVFLRELDDHHEDMDFIAMHALLELAGGGSIDWVENMHDFFANPAYYAERCREWWAVEGEARARARLNAGSPSQPD